MSAAKENVRAYLAALDRTPAPAPFTRWSDTEPVDAVFDRTERVTRVVTLGDLRALVAER
jgi:hypothetical protein